VPNFMLIGEVPAEKTATEQKKEKKTIKQQTLYPCILRMDR